MIGRRLSIRLSLTVLIAGSLLMAMLAIPALLKADGPPLTIVKEAVPGVTASNVTFYITVTNNTTETLTNVTVKDSRKPTCNFTASSLNPGESKGHKCSTTINQSVINTVRVTATLPVSSVVEASDSAQVRYSPVVAACLATAKAYYRLDELASSAYDDLYGGYDGQCTFNPDPNSNTCPTPGLKGRVNKAQGFDGVNDKIDVAPVPGDSFFDWGPDDSFSIETWVKRAPGTPCNADNEVIVGRTEVGSSLHWWLGCEGTQGNVIFQLGRTGPGNEGVAIQGPSITDGAWHHLVARRDGSSNSNELYVDGVKVASIAKDYTVGFASPTARLNIGWLKLGLGHYFNGLIDELALYNGVLSNQQIQAHYNNGIPGPGYCGGPYAQYEPVIVSTPFGSAPGLDGIFTYDTDAVGDPVPTYSLVGPVPAGMTINPTTGLLFWQPGNGQSGSYNIQVKASNNVGEDIQTILVSVQQDQLYLPVLQASLNP